MNDSERRSKADELGDGYTRIAAALAHVDRRRTNLEGGHEGDDMTPLDRMRFAFEGQPRAARYDGDSESAPAREPRCTCGHLQGEHDWRSADCVMRGCVCSHYEPDTVRGLNSDPTGTAAIRPDKASQDLKDHDKDVQAAWVILQRMTDRLARYDKARPAGDAERAALAKANIKPEPGCSNCAKYGHWEAVFRGTLGDFCYRWKRDTGEEPGKRECDQHALYPSKPVRRPDKNHINAKRGSAA